MRRVLCISDIHGHAGPLRRLLAIAGVVPERDQLILLGDYVARGPDSHGVLSIVKDLVQQGAVALRGNHDDLFGRTWRTGLPRPKPFISHLRWGGWSILASYLWAPTDLTSDASYLLNRPLIHSVENYYFVHAGLRPGRPLSRQSSEDLMTIRTPWITAGEAPAGSVVVFGHTPTASIRSLLSIKGAPYTVLPLPGNRLAVDTGAGYGGRLSLVDLTNRRVYWEDVTTGEQGLYAF